MQLADMGLDEEAEWTLRQAMALTPAADVAQSLSDVLRRRGNTAEAAQIIASFSVPADAAQRNGVPDVIQLTPEQFASVSPAFNRKPSADTTNGSPQPRTVSGSPQTTGAFASYRTTLSNPPAGRTPIATAPANQGGGANAAMPSGQMPPDAPGAQEPQSPIKRLFNRLPKLW